MSTLTRKKKKQLYVKEEDGRQLKLDRPKNTHIATEPIKDPKDIELLLDYAWHKKELAETQFDKFIAHRNYVMLITGMNTALRAEDLLQLKVKNIKAGRIDITENKTGKDQHFLMNKWLYEKILSYVREWKLEDEEYLFQSRKEKQIRDFFVQRPITRKASHDIMREYKAVIDYRGSFGLHSLRKTFGYQYIKSGGSWITLCKMYNHSNPTVTMRYVCWTDEDVQTDRNRFKIGL